MAVKVSFQNGGSHHVGFFRKWNLASAKVAATRIFLLTKFGEDISNGGRVMANYMFSKWRPPPSWIHFRCRFFTYTRFEPLLVMFLKNFITLPQPAVELLSSVRNTKWRLSAILNYYLAMLDHPRSVLGVGKPVFKFRVDRVNSFTDIDKIICNRQFRKMA